MLTRKKKWILEIYNNNNNNNKEKKRKEKKRKEKKRKEKKKKRKEKKRKEKKRMHVLYIFMYQIVIVIQDLLRDDVACIFSNSHWGVQEETLPLRVGVCHIFFENTQILNFLKHSGCFSA